MNDAQAVKIAVKAIQEAMKKVTFDANLYAAGQHTHHTERAHKEYMRLAQAITHLESMAAQKRIV